MEKDKEKLTKGLETQRRVPEPRLILHPRR